MERDALSRLGADARQAPELVDVVLDGAVVHGLLVSKGVGGISARRSVDGHDGLKGLFDEQNRPEYLTHDRFALALATGRLGGVRHCRPRL